MTDREALQAIVDESVQWGSCEELAHPTMLAFVRGHLAQDPDAEKFLRIHKAGAINLNEYKFCQAFEGKYG